MIRKKCIAMIPYKPEHLEELLSTIREHDMSNIVANGGVAGLRTTIEWFDKFAIMQTFMTYENKVAAIFALVKSGPGEAVIWAATGKEVDRLPKAFVHACKRLLPMINSCLDEPLEKIAAFVHHEHERSVIWLNSLGFIVDDGRAQTVNGENYFCLCKDMGV